MTAKLAPVVEDYLEAMENFCWKNFHTRDLRECRLKLKEAYKEVWE